MLEHLEIEFKTLISKEMYQKLLKEFDLEDKIFSQTNYYFDTQNYDLTKRKVMLRIRKKDKYKITKKEKKSTGNQETSVFITDDEAISMIKNGFNASIIGENCNVKLITSLTTHRAKIPFLNGTLFFDKSEYNGHTDYEIEYEANNYEEGKKTFKDFLLMHNIEQKTPISKSQRAFESIKK